MCDDQMMLGVDGDLDVVADNTGASAARGHRAGIGIGNRLVIWSQTPRQPHHLDVAPSLALKPAARLDPIEVAVDVELQQDRRMIRRSAGYLGLDTVESKSGKIEFVHKDVDHPNRIVLADPVFQAFRKQRALHPIRALNEAPHPIPPQIAWESYRENQIRRRVFTQPGSIRVTLTLRRSLPVYPDKQTFLVSVGMSQKCRVEMWRGGVR
jgi:hypothetical protein